MPFLEPAYWTDQLKQTLSCYDEPLLRNVAAKLFKPRNQWPADELIERSLATVSNTVLIDRRLKELELGQRRTLALLAHSRQPRWRVGNLVEMLIALGHTDGLPPVLSLLECGLLYPVLPEGVKRLKSFEQWLGQAGGSLTVFAHPLITARALGEDLGLSLNPDQAVVGAESATPTDGALSTPHSALGTIHEVDGLEWPLRLAVVWQQVAGGPIRRTQQGDFFKRDLERLNEDALLSGPPADNLAELPDASLLAVALAEIEGVLEDRKGELFAGTVPTSWDEGLLSALSSLWAALPGLETWNPQDGWSNPATTGRGNPYPSAYLLTLLLLKSIPGDGWASPIALEQWLFEHHPYWANESIRPSQRRSWLGTFLLGFAYHLRMLQARKDSSGEWQVRLSPTGRWLLGLEEAPPVPPTYPQTLMVQPNLEIIAYRQGLTPKLVSQLSRCAAWKGLGAACMLQLSPESVYRALESGLTFQTILQTLERHGMRPVPPSVIDSLRTWADKRERITVYPSATLFEFASADDLAEALSRGLPGVRIAERLAVVASESAVDFRHFRLSGTRDYGLPPEKCVEVDADGVTLWIDLARSDLLVETEMSRFSEPVEPSGREGRRQYRLTLGTLATARDSGMSVRTLEEWFMQRTGQPISAAARLLMTGTQLNPAKIATRLVLHVATPEAADGLEQWPLTRSLIDERLGPTTLAVAETNAAQLRQRLRDLGMSVQG